MAVYINYSIILSNPLLWVPNFWRVVFVFFRSQKYKISFIFLYIGYATECVVNFAYKRVFFPEALLRIHTYVYVYTYGLRGYRNVSLSDVTLHAAGELRILDGCFRRIDVRIQKEYAYSQ